MRAFADRDISYDFSVGYRLEIASKPLVCYGQTCELHHKEREFRVSSGSPQAGASPLRPLDGFVALGWYPMAWLWIASVELTYLADGKRDPQGQHGTAEAGPEASPGFMIPWRGAADNAPLPVLPLRTRKSVRTNRFPRTMTRECHRRSD